MNVRPLALAVAALCATPALASIKWRGDYETGDVSQWTKAQEVSPDRLQVVDDPVIQGKHALKVTVVQGDNPINASGNRNELLNATYQPEGSESYYRWQTMWPADYPSEHTWQLFTQWHQPEDCCGSPPIQFQVIGEDVQLTLSTAETLVWHTPLVRGKWHDFVLHVKFSDDANVGFAELWYDGQKVLDKTYAATRANTYLKQGLYRNNTITETASIYHDGMVQGDTYEDVVPPPPPQPQPEVDAGTPGGGTGGGTGTGGGGLGTGGGTGTGGSNVDAGTPTGGGSTGSADAGTGKLTTQLTPPQQGSGSNSFASANEQTAGCTSTGGTFSMAGLFGLAAFALRRRKARVAVRIDRRG